MVLSSLSLSLGLVKGFVRKGRDLLCKDLAFFVDLAKSSVFSSYH